MEGRLLYNTGDVSHQNTTAVGQINLCRDLSLLNRKNFEHTTRKGVPLVYHCKVTSYRNAGTDQDLEQQLYAYTVPQNWVYRNAAVKLHFAREAMLKKNGITKGERGRYDHTIRYGWDNTDTSDGTDGWLDPLDCAGSAWAGAELGTWDTTELFLNNGNEIRPVLHGGIADQLEDTHVGAAGNRMLATMYLQSRKQIRQDDGDNTDMEGDGAESEFPGEFSVIKDLFNPGLDTADEVRESVDTSQDNPPYDSDDMGEMATFIGCVEAGRFITGMQSGTKDTEFIDVPFGIIDVKGFCKNATGATNWDFAIEVLGVSEMQG